MTTIKDLQTKINAYGKKRVELKRQYIELDNKLQSELQQGKIYRSEYDKRLNDFKSENKEPYDYLEPLYNEMDKFLTDESEKIEKNTQAITADIASELNLLDGLDMNRTELNTYIKRYVAIPTAMKKIISVAKNNEILYPDYESKQAVFEDLMAKFKRDLEFYKSSVTISNDPYGMMMYENLVNNSKNAQDAKIEAYENWEAHTIDTLTM
ncbi:hypothetical protein [Eremococcus coleocola]|uniref:hypothetical protein n=1 Tax=Eremococcus coleocola TaxID=88132 RepID=UPI0004133DEA|nr:hypothetical protein [Eremococcus coleocola]